MKIARHLTACLLLLMLPSCGLINSILKVPLGILQTAGRTVGVSGLTDAPAQPVTDEQEQEAVHKDSHSQHGGASRSAPVQASE